MFLTGRDEILYAVKRLRKILTPKKRRELRPLEKLEEKAAAAAGEEIKRKAGEIQELRDKDDEEEDANAWGGAVMEDSDSDSDGSDSDEEEVRSGKQRSDAQKARFTRFEERSDTAHERSVNNSAFATRFAVCRFATRPMNSV